MTLFFPDTCLSKCDLTFKLNNDLGYPKDAVSVKWTIYSSNGERVSGLKLNAAKSGVGEYYAPWKVISKNGGYKIIWEYQEKFGGPILKKESMFFVVNPNSYVCPTDNVCNDGIPPTGFNTFLSGTLLTEKDMALFLRNENNILTDADIVCLTIYDILDRAITPKFYAVRFGTGKYYAPWFVNVTTGNYYVIWEYKESLTAPLTSVKQNFCVINPLLPCVLLVSKCHQSTSLICSSIRKHQPCGTTMSSCPQTKPIVCSTVLVNSKCCPFELDRVVHLSTQILPIGNIFTNQSQYVIPSGIRKIAFYITYTRGSYGGHAILRLMWGNGIEETQSTLINENFVEINTAESSQNMFINDLVGPAPINNNPISFMLETASPGGTKTVRLLAAEGGSGTPGTISITLTASS